MSFDATSSFFKTKQISGWDGVKITDGPSCFFEGIAPWVDATSKLIERFGLRFKEIQNDMFSIKPPFVEMKSPNGNPLSIPSDAHRHLLFSLMLDQAGTPQSKYTVMQKNKRKMIVVLNTDGSLGLTRDDQAEQTTAYKIIWVPDVFHVIETYWLPMRKQFLEICNQQPEMHQAIQFSLLQILLEKSMPLETDCSLKAQIRKYCYSTNAWMRKLADGTISWKVSNFQYPTEDSEVGDTSLFEREGADPSKRRPWETYTDAEIHCLDHEYELSCEKNADMSNLSEDKGDHRWADLHVKNTFLQFQIPENASARRRSTSCPPLTTCAGEESSDHDPELSNASDDHLQSDCKCDGKTLPSFSSQSTNDGNDSEKFQSDLSESWSILYSEHQLLLPDDNWAAVYQRRCVKNTFLEFRIPDQASAQHRPSSSSPSVCR